MYVILGYLLFSIITFLLTKFITHFSLFFYQLQEDRGHLQVKHHVVLSVALASDQVKWKVTLLGKWRDSVKKTG